MAITFWNSALSYLATMPVAEGIAVILGLIYLVLAAKENLWCWPCAFASTALYLYIFREVNLLSEMLLQVFYLAMAVYGYWLWRTKTKNNKGIRQLSTKKNVFIIISGFAATLVLGKAMQYYFAPSFPYLDAFTTVFAIITTFMVSHKLLENWLYWLVIDAVSIYLYFQKELYFTVILFLLYEGIVILGYIKWRKIMLSERKAHV